LTPGYGDPVRWWSRYSPERLALVDRKTGGRLAYGDLDREADRWLECLSRLGVQQGDRVAVLMGNRVEYVAVFFACLRLRALLVPLNWRLSGSELSVILRDCEPVVIVGESGLRHLTAEYAETAGEDRWVDIDKDALLADSIASSLDLAVDGEDPAMIIYTSGSTGRPKGAVIPHRQMLYNAIATTTAWELGASDVAPISTPFFHTGGWHVFATPLWLRGGCVVLMEQFDPATFLSALAEEGCTVALCVPTQLTMLGESEGFGVEVPSLRWIASGGAPCPQPLADRIRGAGYPLRLGYGLTECGPNCFAMSTEEGIATPGSVGRPVPFLEMRLVDESLADVSGDEPGELLLRGPQVFSGYWNAPEKTADVMTPDGWLRTGDLARRNEAGAFWICGRRKEMFISGGENVFPGEVEAALTDCPGVAEVVVVGVADPLWGEVGRAFVVPRKGASVTDEQVLAHARSRLGRYKVPKSVVVVNDIPRLGSGKPDRRALSSM
jgi:fatty-acyl-CoA synthase